MPALDPETRERWRDMVVVDRESATVGTITAFFLDQARGLPTWALVHSGWLAERQVFVPLADAVETGGEIRLPYTKDQVTQAPRIDPGSELTPDDELVLSAHYGLHDHHGSVIEGHHSDRVPSAGTPGTPEPHPPVPGPPTGRVAAGGEERDRLSTAPATPAPLAPAAPAAPADDADRGGVAVTRAEEELRVGVRTRLRRLRVRKYVVTEYVTRTIPVRREKLRIEELPSDQVVDGGADRWEPAGEAGGAVDSRSPSSPRAATLPVGAPPTGGPGSEMPEGPGSGVGAGPGSGVPGSGVPAGPGSGVPELEVVLHREEPVVQLRTVPVERVRLLKELVTDRRTLTAELRKERVEVDEGPPLP